MMDRYTGYLPDEEDPKDWDFSTFSAEDEEIPESLDLREHVPSILDQGKIGSCTANAIAGALRLRHVLDGVENPKLANRLHIYAGARAYNKTLTWDSGSKIRDGFRFINKAGFMPEEETKNQYDVTKFRELPTPAEQKLMFDQRDTGEKVEHYRITERDSRRTYSIKKALSLRGIPVLGTETTAAFMKYSGGVLSRPKDSDKKTGGHAFYLCGYTPDYAIGVNSWDDEYGIDGCMYLGWDYIEWEMTRDIWVVAKAPYYSHLGQAA